MNRNVDDLVVDEKPLPTLEPEDIPNVDDLVIEDGKPVESIFAEKQLRLLTEPLYTSWPGPGEGRPFLALANVGLFYAVSQPPLVPDVMLSLDVRVAQDLTVKQNRSYFLWVFGKAPEAVIEIVSDRRGGEAAYKQREYARIGISYYVIFDPQQRLGLDVLRVFALRGGIYEAISPELLPAVGLGLVLWPGRFEDHEARWLRWCDPRGQVVPTGSERAEQERQRAERLAQRLRELGVDPSV